MAQYQLGPNNANPRLPWFKLAASFWYDQRDQLDLYLTGSKQDIQTLLIQRETAGGIIWNELQPHIQASLDAFLDQHQVKTVGDEYTERLVPALVSVLSLILLSWETHHGIIRNELFGMFGVSNGQDTRQSTSQ